MKHIKVPSQWSASEAAAVAAFLERSATAIWRAHGPAMAELLASPPDPACHHLPQRPPSIAAWRDRRRVRIVKRDKDIPF